MINVALSTHHLSHLFRPRLAVGHSSARVRLTKNFTFLPSLNDARVFFPAFLCVCYFLCELSRAAGRKVPPRCGNLSKSLLQQPPQHCGQPRQRGMRLYLRCDPYFSRYASTFRVIWYRFTSRFIPFQKPPTFLAVSCRFVLFHLVPVWVVPHVCLLCRDLTRRSDRLMAGGPPVPPTTTSLPGHHREHSAEHGGRAAARARPAFRQRKEPLHGKPGTCYRTVPYSTRDNLGNSYVNACSRCWCTMLRSATGPGEMHAMRLSMED